VRGGTTTLVLAVMLLLLGGGCAHLRTGPDEALSGSRGKPSNGWLSRGVHLAERGPGYEALRADREGGQHWGASRLVGLLLLGLLGRLLALLLFATSLRLAVIIILMDTTINASLFQTRITSMVCTE
jgi:hypothetical protein